MVSPRQATPARLYLSGFCLASRRHDLCRGVFRGPGAPVECACPCHQPEPEPAVCGECGRPLADDAGIGKTP